MTQPAQYISGRTVQEQMDQLIGYVDTRAAEVATDAIASDVAQVHQDMLDADADASAAAASAAAAAGTLANAVKKTGEASQSIAGDISVSGDLSVSGDAGVQGQLSVLGGCDLRAPVKIPVTPTNNDDAASKKYVDDADALKISITDINSYAVGLTGNQTKAGVLTLSPYANNPLVIKKLNDDITTAPATNIYSSINFTDQNDVSCVSLSRGHYTNGHCEVVLNLKGQSGNMTSLEYRVKPDDTGYLRLKTPDGTIINLATW